MAEWRQLSLREAGVTLIDCDHRTPAAIPSGYPYVAIPQLSDGHIDVTTARRISRDDFESWTRKARPAPHDVVLSRRTNPGVTAFVPEDLEFALGQNLVLLRSDGRTVYPPFLRWLVRGPAWWGQIEQFLNVGAVFDSLKCADVPNFRLPIPPLAEQRRIASILGALDDKIELNRRMSESLEAAARAVFKSWFIDFDPTRAKVDGRDPEIRADIAAHFSDAFETSVVGVLPHGWQVPTIGDLADVVGGSTPSTAVPAYWDGGQHCWATPKDLSRLSTPVLLDTERRVTDAGLSQIGSGLLPPGTVLLSSRAPIGYLAIAEVPVAINQGFIAMRPRPGIPSLFLLHWARSAYDEIVSRANGSTFLEISKANFRPIPVVTPPPAVLAAFDKVVGPMHSRVAMNERQNRALVDLRDGLLPRLLSGGLAVSGAERSVAAVSA